MISSVLTLGMLPVLTLTFHSLLTSTSGVARTTPEVNVFPDSAEGATWRIREATDPLPKLTVDAIARIYGRSQQYGDIAQVSTAHASPYVSTALVSRDMLSIIRAHGFEKLQYWGFS